MFASVLRLSLNDMARLRVKDAYGIHRIVYDLFEPVRDFATSAGQTPASGILYSDRGMKNGWRKIMIFSDRPPRDPNNSRFEKQYEITGDLLDKLLGFPSYRFEITVNPVKREKSRAEPTEPDATMVNSDKRKKSSGRLVPLRTREAVSEWFAAKAPTWGFDARHLEVTSLGVLQFEKKGQQVTLGQATLTGLLTVRDTTRFAHSFTHGIGRAKAFGCGLLLIEPCSSPSTQPSRHKESK